MTNFDDLKLAVEAMSGGKNTVLFDDLGMPSIMVRFPKLKNSDVIDDATQNTHSAFIVDGVEKDEIQFSKYQNIIMKDRAYSLPFKDPVVNMTFDKAVEYCENKGPGWHLMTNAEWAAIALWCRKNEFMPRGNNNYGADHSAPHEKGVCTYITDGKVGRVATGSGPASWAHDGTNAGIFDLNGNVTEWVSGLRLFGGEIQIIPYNNAAMQVSQSATSTLWKAILEDGQIADPGVADTLKWDYANSKITLCKSITNQGDANRSNTFESFNKSAEISTVPEILKALALHPADDRGHGSDIVYMNNGAELERLPARGGSWYGGSYAGVFCLILSYSRTYAYSARGFRSAFLL